MTQIGLFKSRSLLSGLIKLQTRSPYSHAALMLEDGVVIEAWTSGGVRMTDLAIGHVAGTEIDVFDVAGMNSERDEIVFEFAKSQIGKAYDFSSVLRFVTRCQADRTSSGAWFCSELCFAAYQKAGINLLERIEPWAVSPGMLAYSPLLKFNKTIRV